MKQNILLDFVGDKSLTEGKTTVIRCTCNIHGKILKQTRAKGLHTKCHTYRIKLSKMKLKIFKGATCIRMSEVY